MKHLLYTIFIAATLPLSGLAVADTSKGYEIVAEVDKRDQGFGDTTAVMTMTLYDQNGNTSSRSIRNKTLEGTSEGDLSLVIFDTPRDVKGTAFLSHTKKSGPDDQWLFLPALKRVKRISSSNQSGPFMGSEFSYEDISSQELEKYSYDHIGEEKINGLDCFLVKYYPLDKKSGYSEQLVWIDKDQYRVQKIEFYDRKKSLLKTLNYSEYQRYSNKFWRANKMEMSNNQTGKKTTLIFEGWQFETGLTTDDFSKKSLKRQK